MQLQGHLPAGWKYFRFGDIAKFNRELFRVEPTKTYEELSLRLYGIGFEIRRKISGSALVANEMQCMKAGRLVTSIHQFRNGAIGIIPKELEGTILSKNFLVYDLDVSVVDSAFLHRFLTASSSISFFQANSTGSATPIFPKAMIEEVEIPLPPLPEQRRVVARIEELAAQIHEARTLRQHAKEEAEALFDSFLNQKFDCSGWPLRQLPDVAQVARGKFGHRPRNEPRFYDGEFPFIQIGDISNAGRYIRTHSQTLNEEGLAISRMFPAGTVAIAITGATIGVTGILGFDSCFPDSIVGIQARPEVTIPEFIYLAVEHAKKTALAEATQTTQPNINLGNLQRLRVRVPPFPEQRQIVAEFDALEAQLDALKRLQAETAAELDALLPSILDKAFKGEL